MSSPLFALRKWAKSRAKQAGCENTESVSKEDNIPLT